MGLWKALQASVSTRLPDAGHRHSQRNETAYLVNTSFIHPPWSLQESAGEKKEKKETNKQKNITGDHSFLAIFNYLV